MQGISFQPEQASSIARSVDHLYFFITAVTLFFHNRDFFNHLLFHVEIPAALAGRASQGDRRVLAARSPVDGQSPL